MGDRGLEEAPARFLSRIDEAALIAGARNLLLGCAELRPGQRLAILHEDPALGWYDLAAPKAAARVAREVGADVTVVEVGGPDSKLPPAALAAQAQADVEIWFARIGDQDRFCARDTSRVKVVSYARTAQALASGFGTSAHAGMVALKHRIDARLAEADMIEVTCPHGTKLTGTQQAAEAEDVTVRRFPMCVPRPVPAKQFSGHVALRGFLTPTGCRTYAPASVALEGTVLARIDAGKIMGFDGPPDTVAAIENHYAHVAGLFDIEPGIVHSWHAGIHAGCAFGGVRSNDPDLWSNSVFGSPEWLHFHTCGDYAPGEICWMVERPSIMADGHALWQAGTLLA